MIVARILFKIQKSAFADFKKLSEEASKNASLMEGCERFDFYASPTDERSYILFEEWVDKESFASYQESPAFKNAMRELAPLLDGKPSTRYFDATITIDS